MGIYVGIDVAIVYVLCALPLAVVLAQLWERSYNALFFGFLLFLPALGLCFVRLQPEAYLVPVQRAVAAFGIVFAQAIQYQPPVVRARRTSLKLSERWAHILAGVAVLLVIPLIYVAARSQHDIARLSGFLEQSRFGEAHALTKDIRLLDPSAKWNSQPMSKVHEQLGKMVEQLENAVASPLTRDGTAEARLARVRNLAMLGRPNEALEALADVSGPAANNLRGTILQVQESWQASLDAYQNARQGWQLSGESDQRTHGLVQAVRGIAFCKRKLGQYDEAEAAYQELLKLAPNAETHFLLAQFYDDAQDATKARMHARQAMALDPRRYEDSGRQLIRKMSVFQFGCWGVFSAETQRGNINEPPRR